MTHMNLNIARRKRHAIFSPTISKHFPTPPLNKPYLYLQTHRLVTSLNAVCPVCLGFTFCCPDFKSLKTLYKRTIAIRLKGKPNILNPLNRNNLKIFKNIKNELSLPIIPGVLS